MSTDTCYSPILNTVSLNKYRNIPQHVVSLLSIYVSVHDNSLFCSCSCSYLRLLFVICVSRKQSNLGKKTTEDTVGEDPKPQQQSRKNSWC